MRITSPSRAREDGRTRIRPALGALAVFLGGIVMIGDPVYGALGTDVAGFDIDGEIQADQSIDDWDDNGGSGDGVIDASRNGDGSCTVAGTSEGVLICDDVKSDGDIFVGGNKESDPSSWDFKSGQVTPKTDITNVYALGRFVAGAGGLEPVLINGMERLPKSGSLNLDFEFNADVDEVTNIPNRSEGDVLIAYDLGGARSSDESAMSIRVFIADASGNYDYGTPDVEVIGAGDGSTTQGVTSYVNNGDIACGDWGCYDEHQNLVDVLPAFAFAEASINLKDAGITEVCFNWVTVRSRASESVTSQLKDTTEPTSFPFCGGLTVQKYIDVGTTNLGTREASDIDTSAEDTLGDLDGWAMTVHGPQVSASDKGPLVCSGTTDSSGVLQCAAGQDLSTLLPGVYTIEETSVTSGFWNTDPGGSSPYVKTHTVTLGTGTTAYVGNTCFSDITFNVNGAPTGPNAPSSVTVEYEVNDGSSSTIALSQSSSTWSATLSDTLKPGDSVDWRFYINGDTSAKKTGGSDVVLPGYSTCATTVSTNFGTVTLSGTKYKDANANGDRDAGELGISGFKFELWHASEYGVSGKSAIATATSNATGVYTFTGVEVGSYVIDEVQLPTGWVQTEPSSDGTRSVTVGLLDTGTKTIDDFGNTPLSKIDVDFTALGDLPNGSDATEATEITCYTDYGTGDQAQLGTTAGNSLTVTNLKTSDSVVTCVIEFEDP